MTRTTLLAAALCVVLTFSGATASAIPGDLSGLYLGNGANPDGSRYEVLVELTRLHDAYQVRWMVDSRVIAIGMGICAGDVLAVSYFADAPGVAAYRIESATRLVGEWTVPDAGGTVFSETLTKLGQDQVPLPRPPTPNRRSPDDPPRRPQRDERDRSAVIAAATGPGLRAPDSGVRKYASVPVRMRAPLRYVAHAMPVDRA